VCPFWQKRRGEVEDQKRVEQRRREKLKTRREKTRRE
jgi:hypothetical protein